MSSFLKSGKNTLHVAVHSPNEDTGGVWSLHKQLIKGIFNHHDTRPGGAWSDRGQERNTGGIWAPVALKLAGKSAFGEVSLSPSFDDQSNGVLNVQFDLEGVDPSAARSVLIRLTPKNFSGDSIQFERRLNQRGSKSYEFAVNHGRIKLWWPFDLGLANLYEVEAQLLVDGVVSDYFRETFAYRSVERDIDSGEWRFNGKRLFLRGTNYIPTQWLSEMSREDYDIDLGLMRAANINTVRVHAHIGAKEFYDAADQLGILVWQDFPLQWGYDDSPGFLAEAKSQALDMVRQFNHHPSIVAWSMQNEPPWDADWMKYKYPDYDPDQNRGLTAELHKLIKATDTTRYVHGHSATAEHPWLGWYSGSWLDYAKPTDQTLVTEFGAQALPDEDGLRRIFPEHALWPDTDEDWDLWAYHNFQKHELTNIAGVKIGNNIAEFIENTQSYQAKLTKYAAESLRRQKYNPVGGAFQFLFNEDWPSINWGIVDYWRNPKPGYQALKIAYQPVLPSLEWTSNEFAVGDQVEVGIWLINDLYKTYKDARYELSLSGPFEIVKAAEYIIDIDEDVVEKIATWKKTINRKGDYTLVARIITNTNETLSVNDYKFSVK